MVVVLGILLIALLFGGLGFIFHVLWWIAIILLVMWLVGLFMRRGTSAGTRSRR